MQRTVGAVFIAVLVVLAGCSGVFGGSGEPRETLTPAPVPTDKPTPTPVPQLAPGLNERGIENASALVAAHASFLRNHSFTRISNSTALASNGSVLAQGTSTLRAGPPGEGVYSLSKSNHSYEPPNNLSYPVRNEVWLNGERLFLKRTYANGTTTYDRVRQQRYGIGGAGLRYRLEPFGTANTSVTKRERNGTTLYLVRGSTQSDQMFRQGNMSLRMLVDTRGVIHEFRSVRRLPSEKNISQSVHRIRFSEIGTTEAPEQPSWVDEAMNRTTPVPEETTFANR